MVRERERGGGSFYLTNLSIARLYAIDNIIRNFLRVPYRSLKICAESRENMLLLSNNVIYFSKKWGQLLSYRVFQEE